MSQRIGLTTEEEAQADQITDELVEVLKRHLANGVPNKVVSRAIGQSFLADGAMTVLMAERTRR